MSRRGLAEAVQETLLALPRGGLPVVVVAHHQARHLIAEALGADVISGLTVLVRDGRSVHVVLRNEGEGDLVTLVHLEESIDLVDVPPDLSDAQGEVYTRLRLDGTPPARAEEAARALAGGAA